MIRLTFLLRRKPGHLARRISTLLAGKPRSASGQTRDHPQYPALCPGRTLEDPINDQLAGARGKMETPYDGVAELWWTNRDSLMAGFTGAGREAGEELVQDEAKFIDLPNSPLWFNYEYPQVNPSEDLVAREHSPLLKLFFCLRHPANMSLEEAQLYWRTNHGPTIRGVSLAMRMRRYLQVHRYEDDVEQQLASVARRASRPIPVMPRPGLIAATSP